MQKKVFFLLCLLLPIHTASAKQYRCSGKIQYRPCNENFSGRKSLSVVKSGKYTSASQALTNAQQNNLKASYKYKKEMQDIKGPLHAKVTSATYKSYPKRKDYGQWRGTVKGNGDIHLQLLIDSKNSPKESRYMGHVRLNEDQTSFNFVSAPPKGSNWTWKILAVPK